LAQIRRKFEPGAFVLKRWAKNGFSSTP
jgi:hypothetical protein